MILVIFNALGGNLDDMIDYRGEGCKYLLILNKWFESKHKW